MKINKVLRIQIKNLVNKFQRFICFSIPVNQKICETVNSVRINGIQRQCQPIRFFCLIRKARFIVTKSQ